MKAENIAIQPVHPFIFVQDTWFQIMYTATEISGCARRCVRDLKPGVLTDNRGVHRLDGNVLGI